MELINLYQPHLLISLCYLIPPSLDGRISSPWLTLDEYIQVMVEEVYYSQLIVDYVM